MSTPYGHSPGIQSQNSLLIQQDDIHRKQTSGACPMQGDVRPDLGSSQTLIRYDIATRLAYCF